MKKMSRSTEDTSAGQQKDKHQNPAASARDQVAGHRRARANYRAAEGSPRGLGVTPGANTQQTIIKTLHMSCVTYMNLNDAQSRLTQNDAVTQKLTTINTTLDNVNHLLNTNAALINDDIIKEMFILVNTVCFRRLPKPREVIKADVNEYWDGLSPDKAPLSTTSAPSDEYDRLMSKNDQIRQNIILLCYDLFHKGLQHERILQMKDIYVVLTYSFIYKLLYNLDLCPFEEKDFLKIILHRIYSRFQQLRPFLRMGLNNMLDCMFYNSEFKGIRQLLEIYAAIIGGFSVPLNEAYLRIYTEHILPLLRYENLGEYAIELTECIMRYLKKDPSLIELTIEHVVNRFQTRNIHYQLSLLNVLETITSATVGNTISLKLT